MLFSTGFHCSRTVCAPRLARWTSAWRRLCLNSGDRSHRSGGQRHLGQGRPVARPPAPGQGEHALVTLPASPRLDARYFRSPSGGWGLGGWSSRWRVPRIVLIGLLVIILMPVLAFVVGWLVFP